MEMRGIYVIELSSGAIKVGRSEGLLKRLGVHVSSSASYGVEIRRLWSRMTHDTVSAETAILRRVRKMDVREIQRETFSEIDFASMIKIIDSIIDDIESFPMDAAPWPGLEEAEDLIFADFVKTLRAPDQDRIFTDRTKIRKSSHQMTCNRTEWPRQLRDWLREGLIVERSDHFSFTDKGLRVLDDTWDEVDLSRAREP